MGIGWVDERNDANETMTAHIITLYLPVFRERLERLERRGQGSSAEAANLRKTIERVEKAAPQGAEAAQRAA